MFKELKGKKLLILGGIAPMIEVINRAHELGITVFVTDYLENSPAKKYADKSFMVSTTDVDAVVKLCTQESIDGVFTGYVDLLLPYYAQICNKLKMPCYGSLENFQIMTDKKRFKEICRKYNVPTIQEYSINELESVEYPVIVKPIDSSGSRGISVCYDEAALDLGIKKAISFSPSGKYIIERYMSGDEVVLYYYFQDGEPIFVGMCDRYVNNEQQGVSQLPTAYIFPSIYTENHIKRTDLAIKHMFKELGLRNGPIFLQAFIENGVPTLYEPGYRTNGAREQYIVSSVTGINSVDMLINYALTGTMADYSISEKVDPYLKGKYACKLSPLIREGEVAKIVGLEKANLKESVIKIILNNNVGDIITKEKIGTLQQVAYRAFIVEDSILSLKQTIEMLQTEIDYYDVNGNSLMLRQFDTGILLERYHK